MKKVTEDLMQEALNPGLSKTIILIGDEENQKSIKIRIMSARKEPIFIRDLKNIAMAATAGQDMSELSIQNLIPLLDNLPVEELAAVVAQVATNSGEDVDIDWLLDHCTISQLISVVKTQLDKQGYLDFLLRMVAKLRLGKAVLPSSNTL